MRHISLSISISIIALASACGGGTPEDNDAFDTYEACWQEHHNTENFDVQKAIEICCIDHPIGSAPLNTVCGDTTQTCETYVTANLGSADATAADITAACTAYPTDRNG